MTEVQAIDQGEGFREHSGRAFLYVLRYLRPHLRTMSLVCFIDISITLINLVIPWFGKVMIDTVFPTRDWSLMWRIAAAAAVLGGLIYLLTGLRTFLYNATEMRLGLEIRRSVLSHLQSLSLHTLETIPVGQQQFRVTTDSDRIAHMLVRILPTGTMLVEFALILTAAVYVDPVLTMIALAFLVPWTILFIWVTAVGRTLDRRRLRFAELRDAGVLQAAASFGTIKALGRTRREIHRNGKISVALQRIAAQGYLILVGFEFVTQKALPFVKTTTIYLYLARAVVLGQMTLGMTVPMIAYLGRLPFPIERIVNFGCWIWQTMVSAERMMQVMNTEPATPDAPVSAPAREFQGTVDLAEVSFSRPGAGLALSGVSLSLRPGRTVAVVGPSGAGKSTLAGLVLRYHDADGGLVRVDGVDVREWRRRDYLRRVGTVTQDTFIYAGTIADNLRLADPNAGDAEIAGALSEVGLGAWLADLPEGISHDLQSGLALSVGQKQRIGIARAIINRPKLLVLDEPTSALDATTEREVMETIKRTSQGCGILLISHRLDTVVDADEILVLDRGRVAQRGTHAELVREGGIYADMRRAYASQTRSEPELAGVST